MQSEEQQEPSAQSGEQLGPSRASSREQSGSAGPQAKKRKLTKMDKMEKSNKELVDVLLQAQEESQRGFMELEKKRMEWHAEQARREDQKEVQFMAFVRDVLAMFVPPQPMPYYPPFEFKAVVQNTTCCYQSWNVCHFAVIPLQQRPPPSL